eukprot:gene6097-6334_t
MSRPGTAQVAAADYSRRDLLGHKQAVSAIAWAGNGKRLASVSEDGIIKLWNVEHGGASRDKAEHEMSYGSKEVVVMLTFNPKRDDLLAVVGCNVSKVYDLRAKSSASVIIESACPDAISAAWDNRDNLVVAQLNNTFTHIEPRRKRTHKPFLIREGDEVTNIVFADNGHKLLVSTRYGVEVWSWPQWEHLTTLMGHTVHHGRDGGVTAIAVTRGDRLMASGGMDAQVCIWDLQSATPLSAVYLPDEAIFLVYLFPTSTLGIEGHYMYRVPLSQPVESLAFNPRYPRLLAFAAETVPAGYGRDGKLSKEASGRVGILQFGK